MAATLEFLSGSTNGRGVKVVQTATAGTTIHTAHATAKDELYVWAYNSHTAPVVLTLEMGGASVPEDTIVDTIAVKAGLTQVLNGQALSGGLVLKAFAGTANVIVLFGKVQRFT